MTWLFPSSFPDGHKQGLQGPSESVVASAGSPWASAARIHRKWGPTMPPLANQGSRRQQTWRSHSPPHPSLSPNPSNHASSTPGPQTPSVPGRGGRPDELERGRQFRKGDGTQVRTPVLPNVSEGDRSLSLSLKLLTSAGRAHATAWLLLTLSEVMCGAELLTAPSCCVRRLQND